MRFDRELNLRLRGLIKGLYGDDYGLFLSNYLCFATYVASRLKDKVVLEICCGLGVTTIGLARFAKYVYAVDIDEARIESAKKNAQLYGVSDRVRFSIGDCTDLSFLRQFTHVRIQAIYFDPGWKPKDDPNWFSVSLDMNKTVPPIPLVYRIVSKNICPNMVIRVPKQYTHEMMRSLDQCELENVHLDDRLVFKYCHYGNLAKTDGESKVYITKAGDSMSPIVDF